MTPALFVLLSLAGGVGAACRLVQDGAVRARFGDALPWGTAMVNLTGSFLLGLLTGLAAAQVLPGPAQVVVGTGFLGGYTTFSTASHETVRLARERRWVAALGYGLGVLMGATALAGLGWWAGSRLGAGGRLG